jgi:hypothetical protein
MNGDERLELSLSQLYAIGGVSTEAADALARAEPKQIGTALGETSEAAELLLVSVLVDDSLSIAKDINDIRLGYDKLLTALRNKSFDTDIQFYVRAMNKGIISPYTALASAPSLTDRNYSGSDLAQVTPLYLQSVLMLGAVMLKAQEEEARGAQVRTFTLIITDGEDNKSGGLTASSVRVMVADMLGGLWTNHIVAGMGVGERPTISFRDVFTKMGIPPDRQYTPGTSVGELEKAFDEIAEILTLAASSAAEFAQLLPGPSSD